LGYDVGVDYASSKKCGLCKTIKLLNEFEIDEEKKDKHAAICKECMAKHQPSICTCSCDKCIDDKIVKTASSSMELLLTRIENGLELSEDMLIMITSENFFEYNSLKGSLNNTKHYPTAF
jgi:hypothetical protein